MPTFEHTPQFNADWADLSDADKTHFRRAVARLVAGLGAGEFRKGLRVRRVEGVRHVFELTFAPDGRATWQFGDEQRPGHPHVIWRRIGTQAIFRSP